MIFARRALRLLAPAGGVQLEALHCVRRFGSGPRCAACAQACPEDAIALEARRPVIDEKRCTACRLCEAACPADAIHGDERDLEALAAELARAAKPVLGCRVPGVQANARTGCLGFLDIEAILALALALPGGLTLNLSRCAGCRNAPVAEGIAAVLERVRALPGDPAGDRVRIARDAGTLDFQDTSLSRRGFFGALGKTGAGAAAKIVPTLGEAPARVLPHKRLPSRRLLLLRGLAALPAAQREAIEAALFPTLTFLPACNNCTGCDGICPTGAITTSASDPPRPVFLRALCTGCGACAAFCDEQGIALAPPAGARAQASG